MPLIRLASVADAAQAARIYAPYCETSAISFEAVAPTTEQMAARIDAVTAERPWIVLEDDAQVKGYAYASPHHERAAYRWSVSTAIYVDAACRGRGIGRALYETLFEVLRHLGYYKASAGVTLPNPASVRLHEAFGFERMGVYRDIGFKMGAWHDVAWYQKQIRPTVPEPHEPRSIGQLVGSSEWQFAVQRGLGHYRSE